MECIHITMVTSTKEKDHYKEFRKEFFTRQNFTTITTKFTAKVSENTKQWQTFMFV